MAVLPVFFMRVIVVRRENAICFLIVFSRLSTYNPSIEEELTMAAIDVLKKRKVTAKKARILATKKGSNSSCDCCDCSDCSCDCVN